MADAAARERSRSPRGGAAEAGEPKKPQEAAGGPPPSAPKAEVPAHWATPAAEAAGAGEEDGGMHYFSPVTKGKGKGKQKKGTDAKPKEEVISKADVLAMAARVESGDQDVKPESLGKLLRGAAVYIGELEKNVGEMGTALRQIRTLTGLALDGLGLPGGDAAMYSRGMPEEAPEADDASRSFMVKKGDEELQEAHRAAAQARPVSGAGSTGGALSAEARTREQMDDARKARLQRLEAQQAAKKKELEDQAAKTRAREAMFETPLAGAAKPLGKL